METTNHKIKECYAMSPAFKDVSPSSVSSTLVLSSPSLRQQFRSAVYFPTNSLTPPEEA